MSSRAIPARLMCQLATLAKTARMVPTRLEVLIVRCPANRIVVNKANPAVLVFTFRASHMVTAADLLTRRFAFRAQFRLLPNPSLGSLVFLLQFLAPFAVLRAR